MRSRKFILASLLVLLGLGLFLNLDVNLVRSRQTLNAYAASIAVAFLPPVQRFARRLRVWLDRAGTIRTSIAFACISVASGGWLYVCAVSTDRVFGPSMHDEFSYQIQARMLARGHVALPVHPLSDSFETFYLITDRVYASQYFVGGSAMFVPAVWFGVPMPIWAIVLSGVAGGMLWLLLREAIDSAAAIGGVIALLGIRSFRFLALTTMSQVPTLLLAMVVCFALLRWRRTRRAFPRASVGWLATAGTAMGWLAITRPLDAAAFGLGGLLWVAWTLRAAPAIEWRRTALAGLVPIVPFVAVQLCVNQAVTGRWLQTPFDYYLQRDMPGSELGFHDPRPAARPVSSLPQKQDFFDAFVLTSLADHTPAKVFRQWFGERPRNLVASTLPDAVLIVLVPLVLMSARTKRQPLLPIIIPIWCVAYALHPFDLWHYGVVIIPCALTLALSGVTSMATLGRRRSRRGRTIAMRMTVLATLGMLSMPQVRRDQKDQMIENPVEVTLSAAIRSNVTEPQAIVLVRYAADAKIDSALEVVYNADVAWPDDARVIRAHDLDGDRNAKLFRYYAERQPERVVYRFDRSTGGIVRLGRVADLAAWPSTMP